MSIEDRIKNELQVHVAWDGRVGDSLEKEYDAYFDTKSTFPFKIVESALNDSHGNEVYRNQQMGTEVNRKVGSIKEEISSSAKALRRRAENAGVKESDISDVVVKRVARSIESKIKSDCVIVVPDLWLPSY